MSASWRLSAYTGTPGEERPFASVTCPSGDRCKAVARQWADQHLGTQAMLLFVIYDPSGKEWMHALSEQWWARLKWETSS